MNKIYLIPIFVVITTISVFIIIDQPLNEFLLQKERHQDTIEFESFYEDLPGLDCNSEGFVDKNCFVKAVQSCTDAKLSYVIYENGIDSIIQYAIIEEYNQCQITVYLDRIWDDDDKSRIAHYECEGILVDGENVDIDYCIDLSTREIKQFEIFSKPMAYTSDIKSGSPPPNIEITKIK